MGRHGRRSRRRLPRFPPSAWRLPGHAAPTRSPDRLARGAVYLWPGFGEAYGLAYLEAQAAGLPVVAQAVAGVPEVVIDGETGLLVPAGDVGAFAAAVARLLDDAALRGRLAAAARRRVWAERSLAAGAARLGTIIAAVARR